MRDKTRYLLYVLEGQRLDEKSVRLAVRRAVYSFLGEKGASEANVKLMEFDHNGQKFLVRCTLAAVESTIAALAFCTSFNTSPLALRLQKMSGGVKHVWSSKRKP